MEPILLSTTEEIFCGVWVQMPECIRFVFFGMLRQTALYARLSQTRLQDSQLGQNVQCALSH
uniref:Uncharacterized protein n=1 Tax=Anguilla anguilla TaxID=7936 RepID=A0A0E9UJK8_ANGAN